MTVHNLLLVAAVILVGLRAFGVGSGTRFDLGWGGVTCALIALALPI